MIETKFSNRGRKKTPTMSALGGGELAIKVFYQITNIIF